MMRPAAGLDANLQRRQLVEKLNHLPPTKLSAQHRLLGRIHPVQHKNTLGRIHTNADKIVHGRLLCLRSTRPHSGTAMPSGAVHPNIISDLADTGYGSPLARGRRKPRADYAETV